MEIERKKSPHFGTNSKLKIIMKILFQIVWVKYTGMEGATLKI